MLETIARWYIKYIRASLEHDASLYGLAYSYGHKVTGLVLTVAVHPSTLYAGHDKVRLLSGTQCHIVASVQFSGNPFMLKVEREQP